MNTEIATILTVLQVKLQLTDKPSKEHMLSWIRDLCLNPDPVSILSQQEKAQFLALHNTFGQQECAQGLTVSDMMKNRRS